MDARDRQSNPGHRWPGLLAAVALCAAGTASAAGAEQGTWQPHKLNMYFLGISSSYSCTGLQQALTYLLQQVGAKLDAPVNPQPCIRGFGTPDHLNQAMLDFSSLQPGGTAAQGEGTPGVWRHVDLSSQRAGPNLNSSDCELVDEFREDVLPLLAVRNLKNRLNCVPFQEGSLMYDLSFDVFAPLPPGATD